jgi:hypothetical protein
MFTLEGNYFGTLISIDWVKKYIQKGNRFPKEAICHVIHNHDLELIKLLLDHLKSQSDIQVTPCPQMFLFTAGKCDPIRIQLIDEFAQEIQEKHNPRWFINYLTNLRVKYLRRLDELPYGQRVFLRDSFLESFELVCTKWSSGILKPFKIYTSIWLEELQNKCKTNTAVEFIESLSMPFFEKEYYQGSKVNFLDYHGPIVFESYWLDVPVKEDDDIKDKNDKEDEEDEDNQQPRVKPLHAVYPHRTDLLYYKEYALQMLERNISTATSRLSKAYDNLNASFDKEWNDAYCSYGILASCSKNAFISSALSNFRLTEFYTKMALMMDLTKKFPLLDKMIKDPYRQATLKEAPAFIIKDICEHILVKYI